MFDYESKGRGFESLRRYHLTFVKKYFIIVIYPGVAQLVARLIWDQEAPSSSLGTRTIRLITANSPFSCLQKKLGNSFHSSQGTNWIGDANSYV